MYRFKLTLLFLVISILAITVAIGQNNNGANTNVNAAANTNTKANANTNATTNANTNATTNANVNANLNVNTDANANANTIANANSNSSKNPTPSSKLQIVFSGADPEDKETQVLKVKNTANPLEEFNFLAKDTETKALLTKFKEGDIVSVRFEAEKELKLLKDISIVKEKSNRFFHYLLFVIAFVGLFLLSWLLLRKRGGFRNLIVGQDNRYSKSKVQIVAWFFVLISSYIAFFIIRLIYSDFNLFGGIDIPTNLLMLSGLSALTFTAAKGITQGNVDAGARKPGAAEPKFADLFQDDEGRVDLADFQMIIVTFLAVVTYVVQVFGFFEIVELYNSVSLPDVDSTILATFGLGQGAYLVKKAVTEGAPDRPDKKEESNKPVSSPPEVITSPPEVNEPGVEDEPEETETDSTESVTESSTETKGGN